MKEFQTRFIELALKAKVLRFGEFTLKSGRVSPYFFNAGMFQSGSDLATLGRCYAAAIVESGIEFDVLMGPAYKGIPLAATTSVALFDHHSLNTHYCYNRKEAKNHGEGGTIVGAALAGRIAIVDDVITAGTAIREVLSMIEDHEAKPSAIVIGLDRQERGTGERSAIQELQEETGVPIISIIKLADIVSYLENGDDAATLGKIQQYREQYGVSY